MSHDDSNDGAGVAQLAIFSPEQLPDAPHLVEAAKEFRHTGAITRKDHELVEAMMRMHALGVSDSAIARRLHVSRNTVAGILRPVDEEDRATMAQKLERLKRRQFEVLAEIFALSADNLRELLIAGQVDAKTLAINMGISVEKMLLLTGQATQVVEIKRGPDPGEVEAYLERLRRVVAVDAAGIPSDGQSDVTPSIPKQLPTHSVHESNLESTPAPAQAIGPEAGDAARGPRRHPPGGGSPAAAHHPDMESFADPT